jgi:hypothetical protein
VGLVLEGNDREIKTGLERGVEVRPRDKGQANIIEKLSDWLRKEFF